PRPSSPDGRRWGRARSLRAEKAAKVSASRAPPASMLPPTETGAAPIAAGFDVVPAGPSGGPPEAIDHMPLPQLPALVGGKCAVDGGRRCDAAGDEVEDGGSQVAIGKRLRGNGTDAGAHIGAVRADGKGPRGDRHREGARGGVLGRDSPS